MTTGIIVNSLSVLLGGLIGGFLGEKINKDLKNNLPIIFGFSALLIGISKINEFSDLTSVVLSIILGYILGEIIDIQGKADYFSSFILDKLKLKSNDDTLLSIAIVTFCFSGTSFFGVLNEALTNDSSILLSKSVLDFFTSIIFASIAGLAVCSVSIIQFISFHIIYILSFLFGSFILEHAFGNFVSVGGIITIIISFKLLGLIKIKPINVLPAFVIVVVLSALGK